MKAKLFLLISLIMILAVSNYAQEPEWLVKMRQVKLMSDSYDDVIKIMGKTFDSSSEKKSIGYFDFNKGRMWVLFASGECIVTPYNNGEATGWKVPKWTVIHISFDFKKPVNPKKLGINFKGFRKYPIYDVPGAFIYENDELGIDYSITREGKIESLSFYPSNKFDYLLC